MVLGFIGPTEVVVILVIALLVFGPHKLPEIGKQVGSLYRELNKMRNEVQRTLDIDVYGNNSYSNDSYDHSSYSGDANYGTTYPRTETPALNGSNDYSYTYGAEETHGDDHSMPAGFVAPPGPAAAQAAHLLESNSTSVMTDASNGLNSNGAITNHDFDSHAAHENDAHSPTSNGHNGTVSHGPAADATVAATAASAASAAYSLQTDQPAMAGQDSKEH